MAKIHDRERPSFEPSNNVTVQRCFYAYEWAEEFVKGKRVADIGCGTGYGTIHLAKFAESAVGVDYSAETVAQNKKDNEHITNLEFITCTVPPITLPDASFDVVTAFQFIEHLNDPLGFIKEAKRILKPGGVFLCTTVNAKMSLARNPFHVFEYTFDGMEADFRKVFGDVEMIGLQGNDRVNEYYKQNAKWVRSIMKWDILGLHKILPGKVLAFPYNLLTSMMRRNLMEENKQTTDINTSDFFLQKDNLDKTWDIFVIAKN
ncbi:class I SAM-dependent methyltransferase [Oscillatoria amoena NRMC-F 0135]|nr:class I SAM-dependent methyltransferase [Oscillatoria amoena NRMC-F 0135]